MDTVSAAHRFQSRIPLPKFCRNFSASGLEPTKKISSVERGTLSPIATTMKRKVGALEKVEADLTNLQLKIKRDPKSYKEDFTNQYRQYQSFYTLLLQAPTSADEQGTTSLRDLIDFVAHVADCYPDVTKTFPSDLTVLLNQHHAVLEPELREKIVGSLVLLRKKEVIDSST